MPEERKNWKCKLCGKLCLTANSHGQHMIVEHPDKKPAYMYRELTDERFSPEVEAMMEEKRAKSRARYKEKVNRGLLPEAVGDLDRKAIKKIQQASGAYIDLPITVRVYLSAIGSVG